MVFPFSQPSPSQTLHLAGGVRVTKTITENHGLDPSPTFAQVQFVEFQRLFFSPRAANAALQVKIVPTLTATTTPKSSVSPGRIKFVSQDAGTGSINISVKAGKCPAKTGQMQEN